MKSNVIKSATLLTLLAAFSLISCETNPDGLTASTAGLVNVDNDGVTLINTPVLKSIDPATGTVTAEIADWLKFMREEEKLAHDLYTAFSKEYTVPVFSNIAKAEANHMNAILSLLETYSIDDPASTEEGVFNDQSLQDLYNTLLEQGKASLIDALQVGALVEETDLLDLADIYNLDAGDDITAVAEALMLGSRNHLRAFVRVLSVNGVEYAPVALEQDEFDAIIASGWERGNGLCLANCPGTGRNLCHRSWKGFRGGR
jgi:hypothetical protein